MFYYRGDTLFNVRYGHYKAHFYTWATPQEAIDIVSVASFIVSVILLTCQNCFCIEKIVHFHLLHRRFDSRLTLHLSSGT